METKNKLTAEHIQAALLMLLVDSDGREVFDDYLFESSSGEDELQEDMPELCRVDTFEDCGILSYDKGIVIKFTDGSEFQISVNKSR